MADPEKTNSPEMPDDSPSSGSPQRTRMTLSPSADPPRTLTLHALAGNACGVAGDLAREQFLFDLRAVGPIGGRPRLPLNLSLVLDRSGSMGGEALEYAKRACAYVVDLLEPDDLLSVVTFDETVDVILPARRLLNKAALKDTLNRITPGGGADLHEALLTACQQVASVKTASTLNRILLLTDGEPTHGTREAAAILSQVSEQKARGVTITTVGFGPDFPEELLIGIARRSGGNYYYIARPDQIPEAFRREMEMLMRISTRNLRLRLALSRGVSVRQVPGQQPLLGPRSAEIILPDMEQGTGLSSLWELEMTPRPAGVYRLAVAEVFYDDSQSGRQEKLTADVVLEFTADRRRIGTGMDPRVQSEIEVARAARALDQTSAGFQSQRLDRTQVMHDINRTKTLMLDQGKLAQAQRITQAMQDIQGGGSVAKTLAGTIYTLDQGKTR